MKRKQIVVLGLVLVIISVGILQYNYNTSGQASKEYGDDLDLVQGTGLEDIPGAAVYVDNTEGDLLDDVLAQQETSGFFAEARINRNKERSKQKDELKSLAMDVDGDSVSASTANDTSLDAQTQLLNLIRRSELESTIETLIKQRGFEDALAYMSETDSIDVMVKAPSLTEQEVAQITDIVTRHADVSMDKITVKSVN